MKNQSDLIVLGLAGLAVYFIATANRKGATATGTTANTLASMTKEIFDAAGKAFDNGWRYFTDGTAIDPSGNYYKGGQLIWSNPAASGAWV